ncbi:MAG: Gfo/Idh/MocA family oxidoreductase [Lachnospiraceae bacterium]|nr:Gfo/Idh/MocA family oxidoreductase [Lachnospiraceae bacterium]
MRIGIIGTGRIAKRFVPECESVSGAEITAVYNPHEGSGERFVENLWKKEPGKEGSPGSSCCDNDERGSKSPRAFEKIEELWPEVDAVYIASPHETHYNYIMTSLEQGKHVLCEKPMTLDKDEASRAFLVAKNKGLVLMEGIKTAYCPGYKKLLEVMGSGVIGEVRYIESCFTKLEKPGVRELTDRKFGGSFRELGSYVCLPILDIFGSGYEDVRFSSLYNDQGIDVFTKADFVYDGRLATAICGLGVKREGSLMISGTLGYIQASAPWWKTTHFEVHFEDASRVEVYDAEFAGDGLRYEIEEFVRRTGGTIEPEEIAGEQDRSMAIAKLMECFGRV